MSKNVGTLDKLIRFVLAFGFFSLYFILEGNLKFIAAVGLIPLLTAAISFCPLYTILGIKTCPVEKK